MKKIITTESNTDLIVGENDENGAPIAVAVLSLNQGPYQQPMLQNLLVDSQHRRKGIATKLVQRRERLAKDRGYDHVHAVTHPSNKSVNALYEKLGYTKMYLWTKAAK